MHVVIALMCVCVWVTRQTPTIESTTTTILLIQMLTMIHFVNDWLHDCVLNFFLEFIPLISMAVVSLRMKGTLLLRDGRRRSNSEKAGFCFCGVSGSIMLKR